MVLYRSACIATKRAVSFLTIDILIFPKKKFHLIMAMGFTFRMNPSIPYQTDEETMSIHPIVKLAFIDKRQPYNRVYV